MHRDRSVVPTAETRVASSRARYLKAFPVGGDACGLVRTDRAEARADTRGAARHRLIIDATDSSPNGTLHRHHAPATPSQRTECTGPTPA